MILLLIAVVVTLPFILAAIIVSRHKRPVALMKALAVLFFGAEIPLFVFFVSVFLKPESKTGSHYGWVGCWIDSKLVLTPLVLWACGSLFALECLSVKRGQAVVTLGLFTGAIVAPVCVIYGIVMGYMSEAGTFIVMIVPVYIAFWMAVRAIQNVRASKLGFISYLAAVLGSLPFWIGSVLLARDMFASLPTDVDGCFVVTAASRGHESFVGPFFEVRHRDQARRANQQLSTLWQFEELWRSRAPRSHALFRRTYNRFGPRIAACAKSPWRADLLWLALKPVEWSARLAVIARDIGARRVNNASGQAV